MELRLLEQPGGPVWVADLIDWTGKSPTQTLNVGISPKAIGSIAGRGQRYRLGQMYGVVGPGLIMAEHVFEGLRRGMHVGEDGEAARKKLAVTWAAKRDAVFEGPPEDGRIKFLPPPASSIFAVYVSPNEMLKDYPDIFGWAEYWTWITASSDAPGAPIGFGVRYDSRLWSKED